MGQGFKPSQQLSYIPILVEVPLPPCPGLPYSKYCAGYAWNAAAFSHTGGGCYKQWSGNSLIQKRAGKWARVNFRKDFWGCYYGTGWGEFGQTAVLATLLLFSNPNFKPFLIILVRCESIGQFWRSTCWYDPWWCLWFAKWFEQRTPWERWGKKGMILQLE